MLENMIDAAQKRLQELNQQIAMSANIYNSKDNELKQQLANHNVLIGQQMEAQKHLDGLLAAKTPIDAPEMEHHE